MAAAAQEPDIIKTSSETTPDTSTTAYTCIKMSVKIFHLASPKPRAEGSSPSAPAIKTIRITGLVMRILLCMGCDEFVVIFAILCAKQK